MLKVDLADDVAVVAPVQQAVQAFGRLDVVVNNAGFGVFGPVENATDAELHDLFKVDVFAPFA